MVLRPCLYTTHDPIYYAIKYKLHYCVCARARGALVVYVYVYVHVCASVYV